MAGIDDLEEYWADLREGRPKWVPPPEPPPPPAPKGAVIWVGLIDASNREVSYDGYRRMRFTSEPVNVTFPVVTGGHHVVEHLGLFASEEGDSMILAVPLSVAHRSILAGDTLAINSGAISMEIDGRRGEPLHELLAQINSPDELLGLMFGSAGR